MALLYRFSRLNDRANTGIFMFIVTRSVTRDFHRDATTKEFGFGYHRWVISFTRSEKMLGVHLIVRDPSPNTRCYADYNFMLLNREHFSKNETYGEKQACFNVDCQGHGPTKWVFMNDLHSRRFSDENGEFLMELTLSNVQTVFEVDIRVSHLPFGAHHKLHNMETTYFAFGGFEWNVAILPHGAQDDPETGTRPRVTLNRLTGFDHPCRVQFRVVLGSGDRTSDSGVLDQMSDLNGRMRGYVLKCLMSDLVRRGNLRVYVEMMSANTISEAKVPSDRAQDPTPNCYDRDKQAWCVEADMEGDFLKLKLFCCDLRQVPRNHLRFVSWNAYIIRSQPDSKESVLVVNAPHCNYYMQDGIDMGIVMETVIPANEPKEMPTLYMEDNKMLTVHIEWLESLLLFSATYHKYDDVCRVHCHQMKREITALQSENYSLERQLFSYQKSISIANSRGQASEDVPNDTFYDRSLSEGQSFSETEYA